MGMSLCRRWMTIGGVNLDEFNCHLLMPGISGAPERDVNIISVPGRNGDLVIDNGRFKNKTVKYKCVIDGNDAQYDFEKLMAWLKSLNGYQRIEECYHPGIYRMGMFDAAVDPDATQNTAQVAFTLTANCKPQRYLMDGEASTPARMWFSAEEGEYYNYWRTPNFTFQTGNTLKIKWIGTNANHNSAVIYFRTRSGSTSITSMSGATAAWANGEFFDASSALSDGDVFYMQLSRHDDASWEIQSDIPTGSMLTFQTAGTYSIYNPTLYPAKPLIRIDSMYDSYSSPEYFVQFVVNGILIRAKYSFVHNHGGLPLFIDCETENCYYIDSDGVKQNANSFVSLVDTSTGNETTEFPVLNQGENILEPNYGTSVYYLPMSTWSLVPRWWTV